MREDYEALRSRYDEVVASHSAAVSKLELSQVGGDYSVGVTCTAAAGVSRMNDVTDAERDANPM